MNKKGVGKFNSRVCVQRLKSSATVDASGHIDETDDGEWETYCNRWARITYARGIEMMVGSQQVAKRNPKITLLYDATTKAITTAMRLIYDGRIFSVAEPPIVTDEDNRVVEFIAVEVVT